MRVDCSGAGATGAGVAGEAEACEAGLHAATAGVRGEYGGGRRGGEGPRAPTA